MKAGILFMLGCIVILTVGSQPPFECPVTEEQLNQKRLQLINSNQTCQPPSPSNCSEQKRQIVKLMETINIKNELIDNLKTEIQTLKRTINELNTTLNTTSKQLQNCTNTLTNCTIALDSCQKKQNPSAPCKCEKDCPCKKPDPCVQTCQGCSCQHLVDKEKQNCKKEKVDLLKNITRKQQSTWGQFVAQAVNNYSQKVGSVKKSLEVSTDLPKQPYIQDVLQRLLQISNKNITDLHQFTGELQSQVKELLGKVSKTIEARRDERVLIRQLRDNLDISSAEWKRCEEFIRENLSK